MREGVLLGTAFPHASTAERRTQRAGLYQRSVNPCETVAQPGGAVAPPSLPAGGACVSGGPCGGVSYWSGSNPPWPFCPSPGSPAGSCGASAPPVPGSGVVVVLGSVVE